MPSIRLLQDVPGLGKQDETRAVSTEAAAKFVEQGVAQYLDFTGQPVTPPKPEPKGKTTNDAGTPALQDPEPSSGATRPRRLRKQPS